MSVSSPSPLGVAAITLLLYGVVVFFVFLVTRSHFILTNKLRRGVVTAVLIPSMLTAPLLPQYIWPNSRVEDLSLFLWWTLTSVTFVGGLRIFDLAYLRSPSSLNDMPIRHFLSIMFFNPDEIFFHTKQDLEIDRSSHSLWTVGVILPLKAAFLGLLLLGPFTAEVEKQILQDVFTLNMFSWRYIVCGLIVGSSFYPTLSLPFDLLIAIGEVATGVPMKPIFQNPMMSTSLRDFWSGRWNVLVKNTFHRAVFDPALAQKESLASDSALQVQSSMIAGDVITTCLPAPHETLGNGADGTSHVENPRSEKKKFSMSSTVGSLQVFLVSAISHEWLNFVAFHGIRGDNLVFFISHGLLTSLQAREDRLHVDFVWLFGSDILKAVLGSGVLWGVEASCDGIVRGDKGELN
ncbi:hypothetical protein HDU93_000379 [Gonapodya sp. JEL0774]|nr:hypothetical protein HDU93_000379 [Gonapodya sp. JEL0774]